MSEDSDRLRVERQVPRLAALRTGAANGQQPRLELHVVPAELKQLATAESGVQRQQNQRSEVVGERPVLRPRLVTALVAPGVRGVPALAPVSVTLSERRAKP